MILQALVQHYEDLAACGKVAKPGWGLAKVSYALYLNDQGEVVRIVSVKTEQQRGKKMIWAPQEMVVPAPVKRSSGVLANFLCDNSSYILGVDSKGKPKRARECLEACRELHENILSDVGHPAAQAVLAFFRSWDPEQLQTHPAFQAVQEEMDDILGNANFVFRYDGEYVHEIEEIRRAWQAYSTADDDAQLRICLVTGQFAPAAQLHPAIKGIKDAQSSGASLVSFNAPAFCSYGREQGMNAPTSQYAAFAYGTALSHLIADREHINYIGDTAVFCWVQGGEPEYQDVFGGFLFGDENNAYHAEDYHQMAHDLATGRPFDFHESRIDPERPFYVLGIAPNAARLSVRFFLCSTFGDMIRNILAHQKRLEIIRPSYDQNETLSLWRVLNETVNQNAQKKTASPVLAGELLRAILTNTPYPATLLNGVTLRIRAEHEITRGRAAIIKAYYLNQRNPNPDVPKEVLTVSLNPDSNNVYYNLGRLFSVLEDIQSKANPGINATIRDRYFNAASATPAHVFPILLNLAQKHLKKLNEGQRVYYGKQLGSITDKLGEEYPNRLTLPQQGSFQLGYYHQTQERYQKNSKEDM